MSRENVKLEQDFLGCLMVDSKMFDCLQTHLSVDTFTDPKCQKVYEAILRVADSGQKIDVVTVAIEANKAGVSYAEVMKMVADTPASVACLKIEGLARLLQDNKFRRDSNDLCQKCGDPSVSNEELVNDMAEFVNKAQPTQHVKDLADGVEELRHRMMDNAEGRVVEGTPTGFSSLDKNGGLHAGNLMVVAAGTSQGKTCFALSVTLNAIEKGKKVAYYSLEMETAKLTARLAAMRCGIPAAEIYYNALAADDRETVIKVFDAIPTHNLILDDRTTSNLDDICASIRTLKRQKHIDGAVVDYLQILSFTDDSHQSQEQLMAYATRKLKNLATELGIWLMVLSQLNRSGTATNEQPSLARLRGSGQIAEAADTVVLIYRPEAYGARYSEPEFKDISTHNTALIDVAKDRDEGARKFLCEFYGQIALFRDNPRLARLTARVTPRVDFSQPNQPLALPEQAESAPSEPQEVPPAPEETPTEVAPAPKELPMFPGETEEDCITTSEADVPF